MSATSPADNNKEEKINYFHRSIISLVYGHEPLFRDRFDASTIFKAIEKIRIEFGGDKAYYLTDFLDIDDDFLVKVGRVSEIDPENLESNFAICAYRDDNDLAEALGEIKQIPGMRYVLPEQVLPPARYFHRNKIAYQVLLETYSKTKDCGFFESLDLEMLIQFLENARAIQGDYVEIGVYKGRSALAAVLYMQYAGIKDKKAWLLDTFEGFNYEESKSSRDCAWHGGHGDTSMERIDDLLSGVDQGYELVKANVITDTLPPDIQSISVCNIDVDMYDAVLSALRKVSPKMQKHGYIIVEDQGHTPKIGGAYLAYKEFLESEEGEQYIPIQLTSGQAVLIKK